MSSMAELFLFGKVWGLLEKMRGYQVTGHTEAEVSHSLAKTGRNTVKNYWEWYYT